MLLSAKRFIQVVLLTVYPASQSWTMMNSGASCLNPAVVRGLICKHPRAAFSWSCRNLRGGLQASCTHLKRAFSCGCPAGRDPALSRPTRTSICAVRSLKMPMNFRRTTSGEARGTNPQPNWRYWMSLCNTVITTMCLMHRNLGWAAFSGHYGVIPIRSM